MKLMRRVYGIDFSGSSDAGNKIWIAGGIVEGAALRIENCRQASGFPGAGKERESCLAALRGFIASQKECAFGLDFPFGLPREMVEENCWQDFVLSFSEHYPSAEEFRKKCRRQSREPKRITDIESKAPFSPCNLRVYRQTYYGIRDVLQPMVHDNLACVLPMQRPLPGKPWVLEICPASTLKILLKLKKLPSYKGSKRRHHAAREQILDALGKTGLLLLSGSVRRLAIGNDEGDALDSLIAAYATFRALRNPAVLAGTASRAYLIEGYVFC